MAPGLLDHAGALARRQLPLKKIAIITQRRIDRFHGRRLRNSLEKEGVDHRVLLIPEGEEKKSLSTVERLYEKLLKIGFSREDAILAFGGGVVGDVAGFVAATFLRGIPYVQLPTTLLAQIDSSIGGKVGVNHERGKNLIGAIHRPMAVWIDPGLLKTLPPRELRGGLFELLKYGFIGAPGLLRQMEEARPTTAGGLEVAIARAVRQKLAVVREDEHESGLRRILNFGHTVGHGLEAAGDYRLLLHGEAVGWGMIAAARAAKRRGSIGRATCERMEAVVRRVGPLPNLSRLSRRRVMRAVAKDKKMGATGLRFILPVGIGRVEVVERFPLEEVEWAVRSLGVGK